MVYSYYPGCTLKNKAQDLDRYARMSAEALGFTLQEIEEWQCCGAVYPLASDEIATKLSAVRALNDAKEKGQDLVTLCSACHHVIKRVNDDMQHVEDIRTRANNYLKLDEPYLGETKVLHFLEVLRDRVGFDTLKEKAVSYTHLICLRWKLRGYPFRESGTYSGWKRGDVRLSDSDAPGRIEVERFQILDGQPRRRCIFERRGGRRRTDIGKCRLLCRKTAGGRH